MITRPFFIMCLIILPVAGTVSNLYFFHLVTWRHLLSGFCTGTCGYLIGALLAWVCRQGKVTEEIFKVVLLELSLNDFNVHPKLRCRRRMNNFSHW